MRCEVGAWQTSDLGVDGMLSRLLTSEGSGLGLSQVHGFAHQSGGTVTIRSELGHGTCVTMYLPRVETASKQGDLEGALERLDGGPALLVEDRRRDQRANARGAR